MTPNITIAVINAEGNAAAHMPTVSIGHPDGIPAVCAAHISILRRLILQPGLCVTSAAFVCQAANVGQFVPCGIHSACPVLSGGAANVGGAKLHDRCCPSVRYLGKKSPDNAHQKSWECTGPVACSGISMPGSFFAKKSAGIAGKPTIVG